MLPIGFAVAFPLALPLQVTEVEFTFITNINGSDIFNETEEVQLVASVIVAVYDPAHNPVIVFVVLLLFQTMVYGVFPPVPFAVICPVQTPLQVREVEETICAVTPFRLLTVTKPLALQPLASVIVTEKTAAGKLLTANWVFPLLHE